MPSLEQGEAGPSGNKSFQNISINIGATHNIDVVDVDVSLQDRGINKLDDDLKVFLSRSLSNRNRDSQ